MGCPSQVVIAGNDSWAPSSYAVDNKTATPVAHANARRRSVLIVNDAVTSGGACHVLNKSAGSLNVGGRSYPLAVGEGVTISTTAEVFVIADTPAGAIVKVIEEFGSNG